MSLEKTGITERVNISQIGMYLRLMHMDYQPKDNTEMADLITEHFHVKCYAEDIDVYETLHIQNSDSEDYEKISRMTELSEFSVEPLIE